MQQPERSGPQASCASPPAPAGTASPGIDRAMITGVVLAGGRGTRMGGADKGLQLYGGMPLAQHALRRLQTQVGPTLINANRNLAQYQAFGVPVLEDTVPDFAGPLAGFITAMENCQTPYLMTVPCDTPLFPIDLVPRLALALAQNKADVAMASALETQADGTPTWYRQPVFCLLKRELLPSLKTFVAEGGRKIGAWTAQQHMVQVEFDEPGAFANVNTLAQLQALQT